MLFRGCLRYFHAEIPLLITQPRNVFLFADEETVWPRLASLTTNLSAPLSLSLSLSQHVFQPLPSWTRTYARIRKREFPVITARRSIRKVLTVIHDGRLKMNFGSIRWENIASLDLWKKGRILGFLDEGRREEKSTARLARRSTFTLLLKIPS